MSWSVCKSAAAAGSAGYTDETVSPLPVRTHERQMSVIQSVNEAIISRMHECTDAVGDDFKTSVRPIYGASDGLNPELIGSCLLLKYEDTNFVVTAAHVTDRIPLQALFVAGLVGTEPVQILGEFKVTEMPPEGRDKDNLDIAFWPVTECTVQQLGAVKFIDAKNVSFNRATPTNRIYMAMGYAVSKNRGKVNDETKSIVTVLSKYSGSVEEIPALAEKLGVSGDHHLFLNYRKYSFTSEGQKTSSISPSGMSGGALVDLGNFASVETLDSAEGCTGMLAGMVIERHTRQNAIVAVKIQKIIAAIRG